MGTTFVRAGVGGYWVSDSLLELWLRLLALHLDDPVDPGAPPSAIRDGWLLASRGYFTGCVPVGLVDAVATPQGAAAVRAAIDSLLAALDAAPERLSRDVLNLLGFTGGTFTADVETWRLVELGRAFLDLLDGQVTAGPEDCSFMPGCGPAPRQRDSSV